MTSPAPEILQLIGFRINYIDFLRVIHRLTANDILRQAQKSSHKKDIMKPTSLFWLAACYCHPLFHRLLP
jgi:hypothetical protein